MNSGKKLKGTIHCHNSPGEDFNKTMTNLEKVKARGAIVLSVGAKCDKKIAENSRILIEMNPKLEKFLLL